MPTDYKHRAQPKASGRKKKSSCTVWFFAGVIVGLFASGLLWLKMSPSVQNQPGVARPAKPAPAPVKQEAPKPDFQFYEILPEMEVVIPREELVAPKKKTAPLTPSSAPQTAGRYVLQIGSFRKAEDAERLKAKVALLGVETETQRVSINDSETFYRVISGPYSQKQANDLFNRMKKNGIKPLVVKLKN